MQKKLTRRAFLAKAAAAAAGVTMLGLGIQCRSVPAPERIESTAAEAEIVKKTEVKVVKETVEGEITEEAPREATPLVERQANRVTCDGEICLACRECEVACSLYHEGKCNPALSRIQVDFDDFTPGFPQISTTEQCDLCAERPDGPVCIQVCPAGALTLVPA